MSKTHNKLSDLNNHLFEELERLNDESLTGDALQEERERAKSMANIAQTIINNGELALKAVKHFDEYGKEKMPLVYDEFCPTENYMWCNGRKFIER